MIPRHWRVLVVEDDEDQRQIFRVLLETTYGCEVAEAANLDQAIRHVQEAPPHLVLLDLTLGSRPGEEVARRLRAMPATAGVPIIVLSEHCWNQRRRQLAFEAGCDYCIDKSELLPDFRGHMNKAMECLPPDKRPD
jgi:CheY-like chemotaxis protein